MSSDEKDKLTGIDLVIAERQKQIEMGRDTDFDVRLNDKGQLTEAACFLLNKIEWDSYLNVPVTDYLPDHWNEEYWKKLCRKSYEERLIIATSLLLAEYDRLQAKK